MSKYTFLKQIGKGGQGIVYLALSHSSNQKVCIKKSPKNILSDKKGAMLMKRINHPNFPKIIDEYEDELFYYQVMEYINGQNLDLFFKRLSISKTIYIGLQLLEMIDDLKNNSITFNDLKPDNILITKHYLVYIIDYGAVLPIGDKESKRYGSLYFSSPEYIEKSIVSWKSDLYSIGKILKYICRKQNRHLENWINKACHHQEEKRFSTLIEAYCQLRRFPVLAYYIVIIFGLCMGFSLNDLYQKQLSQFTFRKNSEIILFHSLNPYQILDDLTSLKLSNQLIDKNERICWEIQKSICLNSNHSKLVDRSLFFKCKRLEGLNLDKDNLHFYLQYLWYIKDMKGLQDAYIYLKQAQSSLEIQKAQIEIAFYLKKERWLIEDFKNSSPEIYAYSLYRLFQLGYYNQGYLHKALCLLEDSEYQELINRISISIQQWGDEA